MTRRGARAYTAIQDVTARRERQFMSEAEE